jgi:hypothetical protein
MNTCYFCKKTIKSNNVYEKHIHKCEIKHKEKEKKKKEKTCSICNFYISNNFEKHYSSCTGLGPRRLRHKKTEEEKKKSLKNKALKLKEKWAKDNDFREKTLFKMKKAGGLTGKSKNEEDEIKRRNRISETMKKNPKAGGYRKGSGRGKSGWYKDIWCDSSWELAWVIYHLDHKIDFKRNTNSFVYEFDGKTRKYQPDFVIEDVYYEIKGRRSYNDLDDITKEKISQFKNKLIVLYEKEMKHILQYVTSKYGSDFIKMYKASSAEQKCSLTYW